MTLYDLADILRRDLVGRRYENQAGRIMLQFTHCETKDKAGSSDLTSAYGHGKTWDEAVKDYSQQISGKLLVFNAYDDAHRSEFQCPVLDT